VRFSSVFGRKRAAVEQLAAEHGVQAFDDLGEFFGSIDIVGLAVPPSAQPELVRAAVASGKHVLMEKPVSTNPSEARELAVALADNGLSSAVFFTQLLMPSTAAQIDTIVRAGGWHFARTESFSQVLNNAGHPFHGTAWRHEVGALWDTGPHAVALMLAVLGAIGSVTATRGAHDLSALTLHHHSGAVSSVALTMDSGAPFAGETVFFGTAGRHILAPADDWNREAADAYRVVLELLVARVTGNSASIPYDAAFGAEVTEVLAAAARSMSSGGTVHLDA
jgi:predicted dehydrogenase